MAIPYDIDDSELTTEDDIPYEESGYNYPDFIALVKSETAKLYTNDSALETSKSEVGHTHVEENITDLDKYTQAEADALFALSLDMTSALALKADADDMATALSGKSNTGHTHVINDVTDNVPLSKVAVGGTSNQYVKGDGSLATIYNAQNALSGDVTLTTASTWYDGPTLTLPAGTYLLMGTVTFLRTTTTAIYWTARIYDGTNTLASSQSYTGSVANTGISISLSCVVTLAAETTVKLQGFATTGTANLMKASTYTSAQSNATQLVAVRLG